MCILLYGYADLRRMCMMCIGGAESTSRVGSLRAGAHTATGSTMSYIIYYAYACLIQLLCCVCYEQRELQAGYKQCQDERRALAREMATKKQTLAEEARAAIEMEFSSHRKSSDSSVLERGKELLHPKKKERRDTGRDERADTLLEALSAVAGKSGGSGGVGGGGSRKSGSSSKGGENLVGKKMRTI